VWLIEAPRIASDKQYAIEKWKEFPSRYYIERYINPDWIEEQGS
jgi:hypothetical protein